MIWCINWKFNAHRHTCLLIVLVMVPMPMPIQKRDNTELVGSVDWISRMRIILLFVQSASNANWDRLCRVCVGSWSTNWIFFLRFFPKFQIEVKKTFHLIGKIQEGHCLAKEGARWSDRSINCDSQVLPLAMLQCIHSKQIPFDTDIRFLRDRNVRSARMITRIRHSQLNQTGIYILDCLFVVHYNAYFSWIAKTKKTVCALCITVCYLFCFIINMYAN